MKNTVFKLRPNNYWDIREHEIWLSDMASVGLHLKALSQCFARFTKGEPTSMKYRIDTHISTGKNSLDRRELLAERGWSFVAMDNYGLSVYSSPLGLNATELYTNLTEQSKAMTLFSKKLVRNAIIMTIPTILMIGMILSIWLMEFGPMRLLIEGRVIQQTVLGVHFIYLSITSIRATLSIRGLRKKLMEGIPINHNVKRRKSNRAFALGSAAYILSIVFVVIMPIVQFYKSETKTLPLNTSQLPIVRLAEVESKNEFVRHSTYIQNNIDWGNRYTYNWSPLAPVQYETDESGIIPNEIWEDGEQYTPSISNRIYQLRFSFMAKGLTENLVKFYDLEFVEIDYKEFDNLYIYDSEEYKIVVALKGKTVMELRYLGYEDINNIVESVANKINIISE